MKDYQFEIDRLSEVLVKALTKFNESDKNWRDRCSLRASIYEITSQLKYTKYEGEWYEVTEQVCDYIEECIPLIGEIPSHITSVKSSGSIGYGLLGDTYNPCF